jgi:hypothetical protein
MADRYWVAFSGGNWTSTSSWSTTTGGASGASVPTSADRALFDANSITSTGKIITVDGAANCMDLIFTGLLNSPTFAGSAALSIFGSLTRISAMAWTYNGDATFASIATGKTITSAGGSFVGGIIFAGVGGGWALQDDINSNSYFIITNGAFDSNNKNITSREFIGTGSAIRSITLGSSLVTLNAIGNWNMTTTTNLTFNAGTSTITLNGGGATFACGGLTYFNVVVSSIGVVIMTGNNTFSTLSVTAGVTLKPTAGTTNTALVNFTMNGATIQSTTAGVPAIFSKASGTAIFRGCSIKDITASGGATYNAIRSSTNVSGNTGIAFGGYVVVEKQLNGRKYVLNASGVLTAL